MIEKIPGTPHLSKLRVIHIIEHDFNLIMGILWGRRLSKANEEKSQYGNSQYGSRKNKSAIDVLLFKHLWLGLSRLTVTDSILVENDAKSCDDRIIILLAVLIAKRSGMNSQACEFVISAFDQIRYHIKTAFGISESYYEKNAISGVHGPGQGGKASPSMWTEISTLIMSLLKQKSNGSTITDPYSQYTIKQHIIGFVDDTSLLNNYNFPSQQDQTHNDPVNQINQVHQLFQETTCAAQWWEELLYSTGGKLELQKCFSIPLIWNHDNEGVPTNTSVPDQQINLMDSETSEAILLQQLSPSQSFKTLGILENANANYKPERERLLSKAKKIAHILSTAALTCCEAYTAHSAYYIPSLAYSFPVGILTFKDCGKIQSPVIPSLLHAIGFAKTTPRALVHGDPSKMGIGIQHLFAEQGTQKIKYVIKKLREDTQSATILKIYLGWAQHINGTSCQILQKPFIINPYLHNEQWLQTLIEYLQASDMELSTSFLKPCVIKRRNNYVLGDTIIHSNFTNKDKIMLNRCRLFIQAETLSDISTSNGCQI